MFALQIGMPKKVAISSNQFSRSECVAATGITVRNFQLIKDEGWWPFCAERLERENSTGLYSESSLAELAVVGGFARAGVPLKIGCFVAREFFSQNGNHDPARFAMTDLFNPDWAWRNQVDGWFGNHLAAITALGNEYVAGNSHADDGVLIIADKSLVLEWTRDPPRLPRKYQDFPDLDQYGPEALGWIENWGKGQTPEFVPVGDRIAFDSELIVAETQAAFQKGLRNAEGQIRVNFSLSIRNAFDGVIAGREQQGSKSNA